ncbi:unnamed protein product [Rhodiola kirilowii]
MTPYEAVYGRKVADTLTYSAGDTKVAALDDLLQQKMIILTKLKESLRRAQQRMIQQANQHRKEVEFQVGDLVLVRLQPYRQVTVRKQHTTKLTRRYYGPFRILQRIGKVAYRVDLPEGAKIHDIFHVSMLRKYYGPSKHYVSRWPQDFFEFHPLMRPAKVLGFRTIIKQGKPWPQYLIQWQHQGEDDATWEDKAELIQDYPDFNLEVEVYTKGGGNDVGQRLDHDMGPYEQTQKADMEPRKSTRKRIPSSLLPADTYELGNREGSSSNRIIRDIMGVSADRHADMTVERSEEKQQLA